MHGPRGLFAVMILLLLLLPAAAGAQNVWNGSSVSTITTNGKVGVGVASPTAEIHVKGGIQLNGTTNTNKTVFLGYSVGGNYTFLSSWDWGSGTFQNLTLNANNIGIGTLTPQTKLHVVGTTRTSVLEITGGSDLAEPFDISEGQPVAPGTVVAIDPRRPGGLRVADRPYDKTVAGIVSGAGGVDPGMLMRSEGSIADGTIPVALTGRVYALADASAGAIQPGDLLTTSARPGHAMRVDDFDRAHGAILGKAMTPLAEGQGLVLVLVTLQ